MTVTITIRHVPEPVRDELASRAALSGRSLQEYLLAQLAEIARRPSAEAWIGRIRERKAATGSRVSPGRILAHREGDRP